MVIATGHPSFTDAALRFLVLGAGGAAIGFLIGLAAGGVLQATRRWPLELGTTLLAAYGSYLAAGAAGASGVMAAVSAGVAVAWFGRWTSTNARAWSILSMALNAVLFVFIGAALPARSVFTIWAVVLAAYAILLAARAALVYPVLARHSWRWRHLVFLGGVRGALSVALALAAAVTPGIDASVPVIAYGVVLLSLLVQGALMRPALRVLRLVHG